MFPGKGNRGGDDTNRSKQQHQPSQSSGATA